MDLFYNGPISLETLEEGTYIIREREDTMDHVTGLHTMTQIGPPYENKRTEGGEDRKHWVCGHHFTESYWFPLSLLPVVFRPPSLRRSVLLP